MSELERIMSEISMAEFNGEYHHDCNVLIKQSQALQASLDAANAHIAELKEGLSATLDCAISTQACDSILSDAMIDLLDKTPDQSLSKVRADAINTMIDNIESRFSTKIGYLLRVNDIKEYSNNL